MSQLLEPGTKVKYIYLGEEQEGIIHGVKTHEEPDGQITRIAYLIDTGETLFETTGFNAKTKKPEIVRQPEQVEIDQNFVKSIE